MLTAIKQKNHDSSSMLKTSGIVVTWMGALERLSFQGEGEMESKNLVSKNRGGEKCSHTKQFRVNQRW